MKKGFKQTLYPKTKRVGSDSVIITEKMDGSNLTLFKYNGQIFVAQRNNIYSLEAADSITYKGLKEWLTDNTELLHNIREGSALCCEWMGMGSLKYTREDIKDVPVFMFAKANVKYDTGLEKFSLYNLDYYPWNFNYAYEETFTDYLVACPLVASDILTVTELDELYEGYIKVHEDVVEGFCVWNGYTLRKYVRMKNGKLKEHTI